MSAGSAHHIQRTSHQNGVIARGVCQGEVTTSLHRISRHNICATHFGGDSRNLTTRPGARRRGCATNHHFEFIHFKSRQCVGNITTAQSANDQNASTMRIEIVKEHTRAHIGACRVVCTIKNHKWLMPYDFKASRH